MNPIPNPVHMVDGRVTVSHIDIRPDVVAQVQRLFSNEAALSHSATTFGDPSKPGSLRQSLECSTRNDATHELYIALDTFVMTSMIEWGSDIYEGVSREQLMLYQDGAGSRLHMDDQHDVPSRLGASKYLMHLLNQVAALVYITTDDMEGGEFWFPKQDLKVPVKTGTIICFPCNYLYPHEVLPVTKGKRIAIARHYYVKDMPRV